LIEIVLKMKSLLYEEKDFKSSRINRYVYAIKKSYEIKKLKIITTSNKEESSELFIKALLKNIEKKITKKKLKNKTKEEKKNE
jgi:hypothetical protein